MAAMDGIAERKSNASSDSLNLANRAELARGFRLADISVIPLEGRLEGPAGAVRLEPRAMELLIYLASSRGQVATRESIIKCVWRGAMVTDDVISRCIYLIRKALTDCAGPSAAMAIETVPKRGYRIDAQVSTLAATRAAGLPDPVPAADAPAAADPAITSEPAVFSALPRASASSRAAAVIAFGAAAMLLIAGFGWFVWPKSRAPSSTENLGAGHLSIVVLPFEGDHPGDDVYVAGLTDEIYRGLGSFPGMSVVGRTSAQRIRASHRSYVDMGRDLKVSAILEGRVSTVENNITLRTRLVDSRNGSLITERRYSSTLAGSLGLQSTVINDVATALGISAVHDDESSGVLAANPEAYRLFLQGCYYLHLNTAGGFQQARDYFKQAVDIDGNFAQAWAALGIADMLMVDFGNQSVVVATAAAQPAVDRALALRPRLAEAQAAGGLIALYNKQFEASADALRRATSLRPSYVEAYMWLGRNFMAQTQVRRAESAFQRAYALDPRAPIVELNLGLALDMEGRYDDAARVLQEGIDDEPRFANLYWAYGHVQSERGEMALGAAAYRKAIDLGADYATLYAQDSALLTDMGDSAAALAALGHAESMAPKAPEVWAARVESAIATGRYADFLQRIAAARAHEAEDLWRELAAAKVALWSGSPRGALKIYADAHIEEHLQNHDLEDEVEILGGPAGLLDLACAYQLNGNNGHAMQLVDSAENLLARDRERGINPSSFEYLAGVVAAMRGDQVRATALLRFANDHGWRRYASFKQDPRLNRLADRSRILSAVLLPKKHGTALPPSQ